MRGLATSTVILLIIGLVVLVIAITMLVRGQSQVGVTLGQADLRNCCLNYCSTKSLATACRVAKASDDDKNDGIAPDGNAESNPDGYYKLSNLCTKVGFDCGKMGELCSC